MRAPCLLIVFVLHGFPRLVADSEPKGGRGEGGEGIFGAAAADAFSQIFFYSSLGCRANRKIKWRIYLSEAWYASLPPGRTPRPGGKRLDDYNSDYAGGKLDEKSGKV